MNVYRISPRKGAEERLAARKRTGLMIATALMVGVFVVGRSILEVPAFRFVAIWITFAGLITALTVWRGLPRIQGFLNQAYASFQITDDKNTITKVQADTPQVSLARNEIRNIQEFQGKGFRICTAAQPPHLGTLRAGEL